MHRFHRRIAAVLHLLLAAGGIIAAAVPLRAEPAPDAARARFQRPAGIVAPLTAAQASRIAVGRTLFFDATLSADGMTSCATCHQLRNAWQDGQARPMGRDGKPLLRHTPTLLNLAWAPALTWDGRMDTLEQQATDPILNPRIGGLTKATLLTRVRSRLDRDPDFAARFAAAFGNGDITVAQVGSALAAFERTLVSAPAPFDRWIAGEGDAIGPAARRGYALFVGRGNCAACHTGWRLTDDGFHDVGMPDADLGRGARVPGEPTLQHAFKTPTLRDVAKHAPYMHDGSLPTLEAVVSHYNDGFTRRPSLDPDVRALGLSAAERTDIVAFLETLTSPESAP